MREGVVAGDGGRGAGYVVKSNAVALQDRRIDAVVVGEFERAFTDRQFERIARLQRRHGVLVWLPEAGRNRTGLPRLAATLA